LYRYALVQVGHALGLLGRSSFEDDAMSQSPSGVISERDKATLRALYAVPSGTPLF
jgi:predicted Zn-dependent protease